MYIHADGLFRTKVILIPIYYTKQIIRTHHLKFKKNEECLNDFTKMGIEPV